MIIVMSDSHGESKVIQDIKATYQDEASAIIHCGDSELMRRILFGKALALLGGIATLIRYFLKVLSYLQIKHKYLSRMVIYMVLILAYHS